MRKLFPLFFILFIIDCATAQIGINTTDPVTTLDVNGATSFRKGADLILGAGKNDNINLSDHPFSNYNISGPNAAFSISGFTILPDSDGQILTLINTTSSPMTLLHNSTSQSKNRLYCPNEKDLVVPNQYSAVTMQYNKPLQKWVVISTSSTNKTENITSVNFVGQVEIDHNNYKQYKNVPGMTIKFLAQETTALVILTASGQKRRSNAISSNIFLRVIDQDNKVIGGVAYTSRLGDDNLESLSFTQFLTGLTPGNMYEFRVQGKIERSGAGNPRFVIKPAPVERETDHLTLTVLQ